MQQLKCKDLRAGDIMLKWNSRDLLAQGIHLLEKWSGKVNSQIVHAGVMFDSVYIVEASARGIIANDLRVKDASYGYSVYRPRNTNLGQGAGTCAKVMFDIHQTRGSLKYSVPGAFGSLFGGPGAAKTQTQMDQILDRILSGKGHPFFCSQFVVYVYQFAGEQCGISGNSLFDTADGKVSPSFLASLLTKSPNFAEAGYVMPNER